MAVTEIKFTGIIEAAKEQPVTFIPPAGPQSLNTFFTSGSLSKDIVFKVIWKFEDAGEEIIWAQLGHQDLVGGVIDLPDADGTSKLALCIENSNSEDGTVSVRLEVQHNELNGHDIEKTVEAIKSATQLKHQTFIAQTRNEIVTQLKTYKAFATDPAATTDQAKWQILRETNQSGTLVVEYANGGLFDQKWDDRDTLFPQVPFPNDKSLDFDGVDEYVDLGDNYTFGPTSPFTWSIWVKPDNVSAARVIISKTTPDANVYGYVMYHSATGVVYIQMRAPGKLTQHFFNTTLTAGVWHHLALTFDGSSNLNGAKLYLDGALDSTLPPSTDLGVWTVTEPLKFGQRSDNLYFNGKMNNASVWNIELSLSEVQEIYNSGKPTELSNHSQYSDLLSWWKLNDDSNFSSELDAEGSVDGSLTNMELGDYVVDAP